MDGSSPTSPGDASLAELVAAVARRTRHEWRRTANADGGPPPHEARALTIVAHRDGVRPGALADRLRISPRSATGVVDALEKRGLVCRGPDPTDRRACLVSVTDTGRAAAADLRRRRHATGDAVFASLSTAERTQLKQLLHRVLDDPPASR